jgi:hypothetical protein
MSEQDLATYEVFGRLVDSTHQAYIVDNMDYEWLGRAVVAKLNEAFAPSSLHKVPLSAYSNVRGRNTVLEAVAADTTGLLGRVKHLEGVVRETAAALSGLCDAVLATTPSAEDQACGAASKVTEACARARDVLKMIAQGSTTTRIGEET